jgi:hypothetical protein
MPLRSVNAGGRAPAATPAPRRAVALDLEHGDEQVHVVGTVGLDPQAQLHEAGQFAALLDRATEDEFAARRVVGGAGDRAGDDLLLKCDVCYRSVFAACVFRCTYGQDAESPRSLPWDVFESETVRASIAYVTGPSAATPPAPATRRRKPSKSAAE